MNFFSFHWLLTLLNVKICNDRMYPRKCLKRLTSKPQDNRNSKSIVVQQHADVLRWQNCQPSAWFFLYGVKPYNVQHQTPMKILKSLHIWSNVDGIPLLLRSWIVWQRCTLAKDVPCSHCLFKVWNVGKLVKLVELCRPDQKLHRLKIKTMGHQYPKYDECRLHEASIHF